MKKAASLRRFLLTLKTYIMVERKQSESLITPQVAMSVLTVRACVCICEEKHGVC